MSTGTCSFQCAQGCVEAAIIRMPNSRAVSATTWRSSSSSVRASPMVLQTPVPISTWLCRNSCVTLPPSRSLQRAMNSGGCVLDSARVSGSTRRYSSSIPIENFGPWPAILVPPLLPEDSLILHVCQAARRPRLTAPPRTP